MAFVQHDDVIEAIAAKGADDSLAIHVLPRRTRSNPDLFDAERFQTADDFFTVDAVVVADEVTRDLVKGKGFSQLLSDPRGMGMVRDVDMHDPSASVMQNDEDTQIAKCHGRHGEEVDARKAVGVIRQECFPRLRGWFAGTRDVFGHGRFREIMPE